MRAVILHTIEDVKHCLKHGLHKDAKLFSANIHVVYYLKHQYGMECIDLCSFISTQEYLQVQGEAVRDCSHLLAKLDRCLAPEINQGLDVSMQYFKPLYSFTGAAQLVLYILLARSFQRMQQQYKLERFLVYDVALGLLASPIKLFLSKLFPEMQYNIVYHKNHIRNVDTSLSAASFKEILEAVQYNDDISLTEIMSQPREAEKKNIFFFKPIKQLEALAKGVKTNNILFMPEGPLMKSKISYILGHFVFPSIAVLPTIFISETMDELALLFEAVQKDFCENLYSYLCAVSSVQKIHLQHPIQTVFWEIPTYDGVRALLIEYFMTNQETKVVGVQSQATFGVGQVTYPYVCAHVFDRCHFFFTHGATCEDMLSLYHKLPSEVVEPQQIIPNSEIKKLKVNSTPRAEADVAIYLGWTYDFSNTGILSIDVSSQEELLTFLERQQNKIIHVVTVPNPAHETCAMLAKLREMKNVKLIQDADIYDYIRTYSPKAIVLDFLPSNLEELLQEDMDIIILKDPYYMFAKSIIDSLKRRVYYSETIGEIQTLLNLFFEGKLKKLRDSSYEMKFCNREGLEQALYKFMQT